MVGAKATSVPNEYAVFEDVDGATGTNKQQQQQPLPKLLTVSLFFFFCLVFSASFTCLFVLHVNCEVQANWT